VEELPKAAIAQPYQPGRTAMVTTSNGDYLGIIGELKPSVRRSLKLPDHSAGFEIDIQALQTACPLVKNYLQLPRFPQTHQDLCLRTGSELSYAHLTDIIADVLDKESAKHGYEYSITPLDIYQKPTDTKHKQTTWRIQLWHPQRTLTTQEVNQLFDILADIAKQKLNAERI
jgi:phenylalanyl-tRNA synthetase beta chain